MSFLLTWSGLTGKIAQGALRPPTAVFIHGDLQVDHVFVDGDEITGVLDWFDARQGDAMYDLAILTLGHPEHLEDVMAGYGPGVDRDAIRACWSLRCLTAIRWLIEHGFDPLPRSTFSGPRVDAAPTVPQYPTRSAGETHDSGRDQGPDLRDHVGCQWEQHRHCRARRCRGSTRARQAPPVLVVVNGHEYRSTVAVMGGQYLVGFSAAHRAATGLQGGDPISVTLSVADTPREVDVPNDFAAAMDGQVPTRQFFDGLPNSLQRYHVDSINAAKTPETRQRRIAKAVGLFVAGKRR